MKCYDCGSIRHGHHTLFCEFAGSRDRRDLPAIPGTQHWTGGPAIKASTQSINKLYNSIPERQLSCAEMRKFETKFNMLVRS